MRLRDLLDKRARLVARLREINDKAGAENRALTAEEDQNYQSAFAEAEQLRTTIEREQRLGALEQEVGAAGADRRDGNGSDGRQEQRPQVRAIDDAGHRYRAAFSAADDEITRRHTERRGSAEYHEHFRSYLTTGERRALDAGSGPGGGFLVAPVQMVQDLLQAVDDLVFVRGLGTVRTVPTATSLGVPTLDADPSDADWTSELATGNEDSTMAFGKRELTPHPVAKRIKVSNKLMRQAGMVESVVLQRMAYKAAVTEEKAFLTGDGVQRPLGCYTASVDGIPTSRDVLTGSATDITFDGLINAKFSLKAPYLTRARWCFHRDGIARISKLKDNTNQYLWQPSTQLGQPDRLLGLPVMMSEFNPNTFTTGLYVGLLGDFSYYWIADALDMQIQRLNELYAEQNRTGFIFRKETDGQPVMAEAFARLKTN